MAGELVGYGASGTTHDFFAYNASNQVWNGSAFVDWNDANYTTYRITATQQGTNTKFIGDDPAVSVTAYFELRIRSATLAGSGIVWRESLADARTMLALPPAEPNNNGGLPVISGIFGDALNYTITTVNSVNVGAITGASFAASAITSIQSGLAVQSTSLEILEDTGTTLPAQIAGISSGSSLTAQDIRDAMSLALSGTAVVDDESIDDYLQRILVKALQIGAGRTVIRSVISPGGTIQLNVGDSYPAAYGREISFTDEDGIWPNLSEAESVVLEVGDGLLNVHGTIESLTHIYFEPLSTDTTDLPPGDYPYNVVATFYGTGTYAGRTDRLSFIKGKCIITDREDS